MENRARLYTTAVLILIGGVVFWHPSVWRSNIPIPLSPPPITRAAETDLPIANSFGTAVSLPEELPSETFFKMIREFSEPGGSFMYENFLSNERSYQDPIPSLMREAKAGRVYLGVGPEQNFTYIAAMRPAMAFIIDIRRQNMLELLMYKALFRMASNRGEFASLLFSRRPTARFDERSDAEDLFQWLASASRDDRFFEKNLSEIQRQLALDSEDAQIVEDVYRVFYSIGPNLTYASTNRYAPSGPSYEELMTYRDDTGRNWSYLASEENFRFVKEMQRKNLIVPLVGDFAGPKAIRTVGRYLTDHHAMVGAFYVSNVEMYILASPQWKSFCRNVAALPMDQSSVFIRFLIGRYAYASSSLSFGPRNVSVLSPMIDVLTGVTKGYAPSYYELIRASR